MGAGLAGTEAVEEADDLYLAIVGEVTCVGFFEPLIPGGRLGWMKGDAAA